MVCSIEQKLKHALEASTGHRRNNSQGKGGGRSFELSAVAQEFKTGSRIGVDMGDDKSEESQMGVSSGISQEDESVWEVRKFEIKTKKSNLPWSHDLVRS